MQSGHEGWHGSDNSVMGRAKSLMIGRERSNRLLAKPPPPPRHPPPKESVGPSAAGFVQESLASPIEDSGDTENQDDTIDTIMHNIMNEHDDDHNEDVEGYLHRRTLIAAYDVALQRTKKN